MSHQTLRPLICGSCGAHLSVPASDVRVVCAFCQSSFEVAEAGGVSALRPIQRSLMAVQSSAKQIEHHTSRTDDATTIAAVKIQLEALKSDLGGANEDRVKWVLGAGLVLVGIGYIVAKESGAWVGAALGLILGSRVGARRIADLTSKIRASEQRIRGFRG